MRIISPFKDYYDSAQAYGIDPELTYLRLTEVAQISVRNFLPGVQVPPNSVGWKRGIASTVVVAFCGKLYYFCVPDDFVEEETIDIFSEHRSTPLTLSYDDCRERIIFSIQKELHKRRLEQLDTYWEAIQLLNATPIGPEIHRAVNSPIIIFAHLRNYLDGVARQELAVLNPRLANFGFQSILDPFTCFQEIAQYLGNELAQPDISPIRTGDDETIVRAKGFDEKSFRTAASGHKKLKRKANRARKNKS